MSLNMVDIEEGTAQRYAEAFVECPICGTELDDHTSCGCEWDLQYGD